MRLERRHLLTAAILFLNFPVLMGLWVWLTEGLAALRERLGSGGAHGAGTA